MSEQSCAECGARFRNVDDSCASRFALLLSLDHSRREPWGSRHGQAFAAFALQHPTTYATSLDQAWAALFQIYVAEMDPSHVFASLRASTGASLPPPWHVPPRPTHAHALPTVTIVDLGEFDADTYPALLDDWCRASLASYRADTLTPFPAEARRGRV